MDGYLNIDKTSTVRFIAFWCTHCNHLFAKINRFLFHYEL